MWLSAAVVIGAVIPFTLIAIMPTDHLLVESGRDLASSDTRMLLQRWGRLHAVRTALGTVGAVLYVRQLLAG